MSESATNTPTFFYILPIITGRGEELFLPQFLRSLVDSGKCCFVKPRRVGQLSPRHNTRRLEMVQTGKLLSTRQEQLAMTARRFLQESDAHLVVIVDDLEDRAKELQAVFDTYRIPLDKLLAPVGLDRNASVHFMVTMIEAYYFADANAVNEVLGTDLEDTTDDPESIRNPKADLKQLVKQRNRANRFDEKEDGLRIVNKLDLSRILSRPETCRSLRSLFKWCSRKFGDDDSDRFQLVDGLVCPVTGSQVPETTS